MYMVTMCACVLDSVCVYNYMDCHVWTECMCTWIRCVYVYIGVSVCAWLHGVFCVESVCVYSYMVCGVWRVGVCSRLHGVLCVESVCLQR